MHKKIKNLIKIAVVLGVVLSPFYGFESYAAPPTLEQCKKNNYYKNDPSNPYQEHCLKLKADHDKQQALHNQSLKQMDDLLKQHNQKKRCKDIIDGKISAISPAERARCESIYGSTKNGSSSSSSGSTGGSQSSGGGLSPAEQSALDNSGSGSSPGSSDTPSKLPEDPKEEEKKQITAPEEHHHSGKAPATAVLPDGWGIEEILNAALVTVSSGVAAVATASLTYAGVIYVTAGSNSSKVGQAKTILFNTVIGVIAYVLMWAFLQWIIPGGVF